MLTIQPKEQVPLDDTGFTRRALVKRVVGSTTFARSERLTTFLSCVCDLTLSGRANEINEQKIGTMLFARSSHYDPSVDGIVRTQASRLRQRLDLYFNGEGAQEPVRIVLPRGSYVPVFEQRPVPATGAVAPASPVAITPMVPPDEPRLGDGKSASSPRVAWLLVTILSLALLTVLFTSRHALIREVFASASAHPLWSVLLPAGQRTMVVPGDSGLVMWQGLTKKKVGLADYLSGSYRSEVPNAKSPAELDASDLASRRYTSIVDLEVVKALSQIAYSKKSMLELRYARDLRPNDLKAGNVILIGAAAANPWVELFEPNMNFVFSDAHIRQYTVLNRKPVGTEPPQWSSDYSDAQHRVYGVVAFLPNVSGKGNVLLLEGTSMPGTECAWDFVSDDSVLLPFLARVKRANGSIPHFQLVLGTNNMNGSSVKSSILAWRVMD